MSAQSLTLPRGSIIRHVDYQIDQGVNIWVEVNPQEPNQDVHILQVFGTGHDIPSGSLYLGTWQEPPFVWHLYEVF